MTIGVIFGVFQDRRATRNIGYINTNFVWFTDGTG